MAQLRIAAHDPAVTGELIELVWRATHDIKQILAIIPNSAAAYTAAQYSMVLKGNVAEANAGWDKLTSLGQPVADGYVLAYFDLLGRQKQYAAAETAWQQLTSRVDQYRPYAKNTNLVVNGGFEAKLLNGALDWVLSQAEGVSVTLDHYGFHEGSRSLAFDFDGRGGPGILAVQLIPVSGNEDYEMSVAMKATGLTSAHGVRVTVTDAESGAVLGATEAISGTTHWRQLGASFHTPPETRAVVLQIGRASSGTLIKGKLWTDAVRLQAKSNRP
jgi:hypothetical protein